MAAAAKDKIHKEAVVVQSRRRSKLVECPFEVRIDGKIHDQFYDIRDAVTSARVAKRAQPTCWVVVIDARTGKLIIEVEA